MTSETLRNIIPQAIFRGARNILCPLYNHKKESDRQGKHDKWTPGKHIALTTLAILTDVGFNSGTIILVLTGHPWQAGAVKSAHIIGSQVFPQPITDLKKRIFDKYKREDEKQ